jgi:hypothetical protein
MKHIIVDNCVLLTSPGVVSVLEGFPSITHLNCINCPKVNCEQIKSLFLQRETLTEVQISLILSNILKCNTELEMKIKLNCETEMFYLQYAFILMLCGVRIFDCISPTSKTILITQFFAGNCNMVVLFIMFVCHQNIHWCLKYPHKAYWLIRRALHTINHILHTLDKYTVKHPLFVYATIVKCNFVLLICFSVILKHFRPGYHYDFRLFCACIPILEGGFVSLMIA